MGLDFTAEGAYDAGLDMPRWTYSGFMRFRKAIAATDGIDLLRMEGFGRSHLGESDEDLLAWAGCDSPLRPLLDHSDCDGELTPSECRIVAPALRTAIDKALPEGIEPQPGAHRDRSNGLLLVAAMEWCERHRVPLEFC